MLPMPHTIRITIHFKTKNVYLFHLNRQFSSTLPKENIFSRPYNPYNKYNINIFFCYFTWFKLLFIQRTKEKFFFCCCCVCYFFRIPFTIVLQFYYIFLFWFLFSLLNFIIIDNTVAFKCYLLELKDMYL